MNYKILNNESTQLGIQLVLQVLHQFGHNLVNLLIVQRGILILQQETHRVTLLTGFQILTLINVEERDLLQQLFSVS